jgi:hypothetical protein
MAPTLPAPGAPGAGAAGGGGGGRGAGARSDALDQASAGLQQRIRDLELERQTLGMSTAEIERRKAALDLERAAEEAGLAITPERRAAIDQLAEVYGREVEQLDELKATYDELEAFKGQAIDTLASGFTDAILGAKSLEDALKGIVEQLAKMALQAAFRSLFGSLFGGLFGFADGGPVKAASGGRIAGPGTSTSDTIPALLSDGEYVINAKSARQHGALLDAINSGRIARLAQGGAVTPSPRLARPGATGGPAIGALTINTKVEGSAGTPEQNQDLARRTAKEVESTIRKLVVREITQQKRPGGILR